MSPMTPEFEGLARLAACALIPLGALNITYRTCGCVTYWSSVADASAPLYRCLSHRPEVSR